MDTSGTPERMVINKDSGTSVVIDIAPSGDTVSKIRLDALHYDNAGADTGEFVQIRVTKGYDISGLKLELLNGVDGTAYDTATAADLSLHSSSGNWDYYRWAPADIINDPGGVALALDDVLLDAISYEGVFDVQAGIAADVTTKVMEVHQDGTGSPDDFLFRDGAGVWDGGPLLNAPVAKDDLVQLNDGHPNSIDLNGHLLFDNGNGQDESGVGPAPV